LLPKWVAPNLITLTGMFALFYAYALFLVYLPALEGAQDLQAARN